MQNVFHLKDIQKFLVKSFIALGPLGNILTPQLISRNFRTYYLVLSLFPLFYLFRIHRNLILPIAFFPFLFYCFLSVLHVKWIGEQNEEFQLLLFFLLFTQLFFVVGASQCFSFYQELTKLICIYIKSFTFSLCIGFVFYISFYFFDLQFSVVERFSVIAQMGYGLLRFSPGSYANEYGNVASFVLTIFTWNFIDKKNTYTIFSKFASFIFSILSFGALLLTTTRSAYLSYFFMVCYIGWKERKMAKILAWFGFALLFFCLLLRLFQVNLLGILLAGFSFNANLDNGSLLERVLFWQQAKGEFIKSPWFGKGFSFYTNLHNTYLQIIYELGIVGSCLLLAGIFVTYFEWGSHSESRVQSREEIFIRRVIFSGVAHVAWFALSNHNLNHHLTWMTVFLCLAFRIVRRKEILFNEVFG